MTQQEEQQLLEEIRQDMLEEARRDETFEAFMRTDYEGFLKQIEAERFEDMAKDLEKQFDKYGWDFKEYLTDTFGRIQNEPIIRG